jgi:uncharacterized protein YdeI (YjbR/CyaY-like superfamily)
MEQYDARVDAYIEKAAPFAKPILEHIRRVVHEVSPLITESIKWSMPFFEYKGPICQMAAFKQHLGFGFWRASRLNDPYHLLRLGGEGEESAGGSFGRVYKIEDLPSEAILKEFVAQAMHLNEMGGKGIMHTEPKKKPAEKRELAVPDYFTALLGEHPKAKEIFEKFSPSHKKEYVEWIVEAKTDATREKRLAQAIEMMEEGKSKNWKYR